MQGHWRGIWWDARVFTGKRQRRTGELAIAYGFFSWVVDLLLYPIDTVSTRLKGTEQKINVKTTRYLWQTMRREKLGLYRGFMLTLPQSSLPKVLYIYIYQSLMDKAEDLMDSSTTSNYRKLKLFFPFFISAFAESFALMLELPLDMVRTRIQMNNQQYQYSSALTGLREIKEKEGILRLYKAMKIYFATKMLYTVVQFQAFDFLNQEYSDYRNSIFFNSVFSAVMATIILNPMEVLITRYALFDTTKKKLVLSNMVQSIMQQEGFAGFYKGFLTEVMLRSVYSLLWLPVFLSIRNRPKVNNKK